MDSLKNVKSFGSDNHSGVHPAVLEAIRAANFGHQAAYGGDTVTEEAETLLRSTFGPDVRSFFLFTGTAANTLAIRALCQSYEAVVATRIAHIEEDECGAPEHITGCKLLTFPHVDGKLPISVLETLTMDPLNPHRVFPRLLSITQATELGTVYPLQELRSLIAKAHGKGLLVHMDGARLANAAVSLGCSLAETSLDLGVDVLSFGGTKNGLLCAEALIFRSSDLAARFPYIRKQNMQLASKMRYLSCQFLPYLRDGLWRDNAAQANKAARYLKDQLEKHVPGIEIPYPTEANEVFARIPAPYKEKLEKRAKAYKWEGDLLRFVCSFDTTKEDVDRLFIPE